MKNGDIVGQQYEVQSPLGEGSMGAVYKGWDRSLDRPVAIKVLKPDVGSGTERFRREAQLLANLNHGNICQVYSLVQHEGRAVMVLQYLDGTPLDDVLKRQGPLPWDEVKQIAADVLAGLTEAHHAKVVHRDLKPANLMRVAAATGPKTVIMDFGIARAQGQARATREGMVSLTIEYASPQQIQGEDVGPASDLYSLGMVLYELLTGELAFDAKTDAAWAHAHLYEAPDWGKVEALHGKAVVKFLQQATQKTLAERYASAPQMAQALQAVKASAPGRGRTRGSAVKAVAGAQGEQGSGTLLARLRASWHLVFLGIMLALGASFFLAGLGGDDSANARNAAADTGNLEASASVAPVEIRPLANPVEVLANPGSPNTNPATGQTGTVQPTHTLNMGNPEPPAPNPSARPVEAQAKPVAERPPPKPAAKPKPQAQRPSAPATPALTCDSLSFGLRIACTVEGPAIIQKCAPDLRNWNHNLPGCNRQRSNNIAN